MRTMLTARVNGELLRSIKSIARAAELTTTDVIEVALRRFVDGFLESRVRA
jgi:hypothetical protein